jgi:hypothetical protein
MTSVKGLKLIYIELKEATHMKYLSPRNAENSKSKALKRIKVSKFALSSHQFYLEITYKAM